MKTTTLLFLVIIISGQIFSQTQDYSAFKLRTLNGEEITSADLFKTEQATVYIFWKSGSSSCCENLDNMQTAWLDQLKEKNVRFVAICIDFNGDWSHVKPFVYGKNWEFEVYLDVQGDCRRAMGVTTVPFTVLLDENQKLVCSYAGYCNGNEEMLCSKILHLLSLENEELISENLK